MRFNWFSEFSFLVHLSLSENVVVKLLGWNSAVIVFVHNREDPQSCIMDVFFSGLLRITFDCVVVRDLLKHWQNFRKLPSATAITVNFGENLVNQRFDLIFVCAVYEFMEIVSIKRVISLVGHTLILIISTSKFLMDHKKTILGLCVLCATAVSLLLVRKSDAGRSTRGIM